MSAIKIKFSECGCCVPAGIDDSVASVASSAVVGFLGLVFGLASLLVAVAYARRVKKAKKVGDNTQLCV